jgi:hypothetical protein
MIGAVVLGVSSSALCLQAALDAVAGGLPPEEKPKLCDDACVKELENVRWFLQRLNYFLSTSWIPN